MEEKDEEEVEEEDGAADVDEVEDGEELRQKILDLEKVIAEKKIENRKLKDVLRQARTHLRMVKEDSEKLNELENVKEENEELVLRLKQSSEKLDDLEVLKEENKELYSRLKQDHEMIENLEAQVTSLHSQKQMESNQNEKLKKKNAELEASRKRYVIGLDKLNFTATQVGAMQDELTALKPNLERTVKETEELIIL